MVTENKSNGRGGKRSGVDRRGGDQEEKRGSTWGIEEMKEARYQKGEIQYKGPSKIKKMFMAFFLMFQGYCYGRICRNLDFQCHYLFGEGNCFLS